MAVSNDTQHLHVFLGGSRQVLRLRLPELTVEKSFRPTKSDGSTLPYVSTVLNLPTDPKSVVLQDGEEYGTLWIFDDGLKRANAATANSLAHGVEYGSITADGTTMYGLSGIGGGLSQWTIAPDGFHFVAMGPQPNGGGTMGALACQANVCFTGSGTILSTSTLLPAGQATVDVNTLGTPLIDLAHNRTFLVSGWADLKITSYDATSYQVTGQYVLSQFAAPHTVQLLPGNQLAIANSQELALVPVSLLNSH
jgi:hypothetical protein